MSINTLGEQALSGQEAIQALNLYIEELENQKTSDTINEHADTWIEIAKALCQAISKSETGKTNENQTGYA